jgi:hypothetical protein
MPILANVYLHYVFDLWTHRWRRKATGDVIVIRYADDTIVGFQHEHEAKAFLDDLKERLREFELALHPAKTRLIRFGRHAAQQREKRGEGKPETFDFLGFTHFCTRSRKYGSIVIGRKTIKKRMRATLQTIKMEPRKRLHDPIAKTGAWVYSVLKGHLNYFAVSGNDPSLWWCEPAPKWDPACHAYNFLILLMKIAVEGGPDRRRSGPHPKGESISDNKALWRLSSGVPLRC